jgi:hypothetical protein
VSDEQVFAKVFGGEFPVCNEEQKVDLEAAYGKMLEKFPDGQIKYDNNPCTCEVITSLLKGEAVHEIQMSLALKVAQEIYAKKEEIVNLGGLLEQLREGLQKAAMSAPASAGGAKETLH